jgi:hypothetical protein
VSARPLSAGSRHARAGMRLDPVASATVLVMTVQLMTVQLMTARFMTARLMTVPMTAVRAGRGRAVPALGRSDSPYARRGAGLVRGRAA